MSIHNSLKVNKWKTKRSVRKRWERLAKLKRTLKWIEGMSVFGMPKEKILRLKLKLKEKKKELTEAEKQTQLYSSVFDSEKKKKKKSRDDKETRRR